MYISILSATVVNDDNLFGAVCVAVCAQSLRAKNLATGAMGGQTLVNRVQGDACRSVRIAQTSNLRRLPLAIPVALVITAILSRTDWVNAWHLRPPRSRLPLKPILC